MKVSAVLLDRETKEIKIYFEHTNHCVRAPFTWQNIALYEYFNNIVRDRIEMEIADYSAIIPQSDIEDLLAPL